MKPHSIARPKIAAAFAIAALALAAAPAFAQRAGFRMPNVDTRAVNIWSDGTRLSGDLFYPKDMKPDGKLPALVLCHGWGGTRSHLNQAYAPFFAAQGFVVLTFDYRGWGDSDSRLVIQGGMPKPGADGKVKVEARAIRELVDPYDQTEDIASAINFICGEPGVDPERIGLWGTSYGGGHVVYIAARDPRVKSVVAQVGSMDSARIPDSPAFPGGMERAKSELILRARGEGNLDPVPQGVDIFQGLRGTPYVARMATYRPVESAAQVKAATLIIDVDKEELFKIEDNGKKVFEILQKAGTKSKYHLFEGYTHYDIYTKLRQQGLNLAIEWFKETLGADAKEAP